LWQQLSPDFHKGDLIVGDVALGPTPSPTVVPIPEVGNITMTTLDQVLATRTQVSAEAHSLDQQASAIESQAVQKFADAGAIMVPRQTQGTLPGPLAPEAEKAHQLVAQITSVDRQLQELGERTNSGFRALIAKLGDRSTRRKLQGQRDAASSDLRQVLVAVGRGGGSTPIAEAAALIAEASELEQSAEQFKSVAAQKSMQVTVYDHEISLRRTSQKEMGFDALYTAAYLTTYGAPDVQSPLELKKDEHAYLSVSATLSRNQTRTRFVGGSQGFSFPIGHTGIRYRVGSFHGQPISQQVLTRIDSGSLVISSQRIAFIGTLKSVLIQLVKVVHIEVYNDAVAVFHEGRENPDFFLVQSPNQVVFYVNWAIDKLKI